MSIIEKIEAALKLNKTVICIEPMEGIEPSKVVAVYDDNGVWATLKNGCEIALDYHMHSNFAFN